MWDRANIAKNVIFKAGHAHQLISLSYFWSLSITRLKIPYLNLHLFHLLLEGLMNVQNVHATFHLLLPCQNANQCVPTQNLPAEESSWRNMMTFETRKTCEEDCFTKYTKTTGHPMSARWCKNCTTETLGNVNSEEQEAEVATIAWEAESDDLMQTAAQPQARHGHRLSWIQPAEYHKLPKAGNTRKIVKKQTNKRKTGFCIYTTQEKHLFALLKWPNSV